MEQENQPKHKPEFEAVGSPFKIPRTRPPLPRYGPGLDISRAEVLPHDDEEISEDEEDLFPCSDEEYEEGENSNLNLEPLEVPAGFFNEELGPPEVDQESLQVLDDRPTVKEITRLTKMEVVELVNLQKKALRTSPSTSTSLQSWCMIGGIENQKVSDQQKKQLEQTKTQHVVGKEDRAWWLENTRKWRRKTMCFLLPPVQQSKLLPMLRLAYRWSLWSVDVKDAFLQVPQRTACLCKIPSEVCCWKCCCR